MFAHYIAMKRSQKGKTLSSFCRPRTAILILAGCICCFLLKQQWFHNASVAQPVEPGQAPPERERPRDVPISKPKRKHKNGATTSSVPAGKNKQQQKKKQKTSTSKIPPVRLGWNLTGKGEHDRTAFTQGLVFVDGYLYETTGLYGGRSKLRKVEVGSGKILKEVDLGSEYFGEGMTIVGSKIYVLTWKEHTGFIFDKDTFKLLKTFTFDTARGEGWGLTHDPEKKEFIVSDGSEYLHFWDVDTLKEVRRVRVQDHKGYVKKINELEYVKLPKSGKSVVLANIWYADDIIVIDPDTGYLVAEYWMDGLLAKGDKYGGEDCLNGIAHDPATGTTYLTGKLYSKMYTVNMDFHITTGGEEL